MNNCIQNTIDQALDLVSGIRRGRKTPENLERTFIGSLGDNVNPEALAHIIHGAVQLSPAYSFDIATSFETIAELDAFVAENRLPQDQVDANLAKLAELPGYETIESTIETIQMKTNSTVQVIESTIDRMEDTDSRTDVEGKSINVEIRARDILDISAGSTEIIQRQEERIEKSRGLKKGSAGLWSTFVDTYFPGMPDIGAMFTNSVKDEFYEKLMDNTNSKKGFLNDVDKAINKIKSDLASKVEAGKNNPDAYADDANKLRTSDAVRERYFNEIFAADFDFILDNVIKFIAISDKQTKQRSAIINGFLDLGGEPMEGKAINSTPLNEYNLFKKDKGNVYNFNSDVATDTAIWNKLDMNTTTFFSDDTLPNNTFYEIAQNKRVFFRDSKGNNIEVTPKAYYEYSTANNRNVSSIDSDVNPLDSGTAFINNLFQMFRTVTETGPNEYVLGGRLTTRDFLSIAPYLVDAGLEQDAFRDKLASMADNTRIGKIARSLLFYVFNDTYTDVKKNSGSGPKGMYSLFQAASAHSSFHRGSINNNIINALHSALISKDVVRMLKVEEGRTTVTAPLGEGTENNVIDEALAGHLMNDKGYTKGAVANKIRTTSKSIDIIIKPATATSEVILLPMEDITSSETIGGKKGMKSVANLLGLGVLFKRIQSEYTKKGLKDADVIDVFKGILVVAAANKKKTTYKLDAGKLNSITPHKDYMVMSPSNEIVAAAQGELADVFNVDITRNQTVAGKKLASTTTPNRDTFIPKQIREFKRFQKEVNDVPIQSNAFLLTEKAEGSNIVPATVEGTLLKAPIVLDGEAIKLSEWTLKDRVEYAMVQGLIKAPKKLGYEMYIQPVNYSDKSNIEMHKVVFQENIMHNKGLDNLKKGYIEYQQKRYEDLQRISINSLREYIAGDFESIYDGIQDSNEEGNEDRLTALRELRDHLMTGDYKTAEGDFTRPINMILKRVKLKASELKFTGARLDADADYISFKDGTAFLKPHLGVRAEAFRDPKRAKSIVEEYLVSNRSHMKSLGINEKAIASALKQKNDPSISNNIQGFIDRFFLINGIYGHGLKVITMGDESYFKSRYSVKDLDSYYMSIDNGEATGLEETKTMLQNQFKRAQSELSRGVLYSQKKTLEGLRRGTSKNNILQYLDLFVSDSLVEGKKKRDYDMSFEAIEGKTFNELEGMGILEKFEDGSLIQKGPKGSSFKVNIGDSLVTFGNFEDGRNNLSDSINAQLVQKVSELLYNAEYNISSEITPESNVGVDPDPAIELGVRTNSITLKDILNTHDSLEKTGLIQMPDLIPSITVEDPSSYINLLNDMNIDQENSDAIQFIHPLMRLITEHARGNSMGAFDTDNQEAIKTLTTTFEYDKMRQVLQKKSVQNPWGMEQMSKLGSVELFNALKMLNTAIPFKQTSMLYTSVGRLTSTEVIEAKNLDDLFNHFNGYSRNDDSAWKEVMEVLRQNPINMYSFVGLISVPSNQKTGHKKMNKFEGVFANKNHDVKPNIDYTSNEFNFEILTKAHDVDVSGKLSHSSSLTLLSQLVNAVAFGGLSNVTTRDLQNAMSSKMLHNREAIWKEMSSIALEIEANKEDKEFVAASIASGNVDTSKFTESQVDVYRRTMRIGVVNMAKLAFDANSDSELIKEIIEGEGYSLDAPEVYAKVMGTLRSSFFKDTVKMKMSGFIGTVSAAHKTINIFDLPDGRRAGRKGYIHAAFTENIPGLVHKVTAENIDKVEAGVLPFDRVKVGNTFPLATDVDMRAAIAEGKTVEVVFTPDLSYTSEIADLNDFNALGSNSLIKLSGEGGGTFYKWYLEEKLGSPQAVIDAISKGKIEEDITERYSLRWYIINKVTDTGDGINDILDTEAYKAFYRATMEGAPESKLKKLRALLTIETQRKDANGEPIWKMKNPEVVIPNYMRAAFNLPQNQSLVDIVGVTDNADTKRLNAQAFFNKHFKTGNKYQTLPKSKATYTAMLKRIYSGKVFRERNAYDKKILAYLKKNENGDTLSSEGVTFVNNTLLEAKEDHMKQLAADFVKALDVVMTRIPGQSKQSGFVGTVVEFMDTQGNATFAPTEHLVTTGGDLDIDTLSVLTRTLSADSRIEAHQHFTDPKTKDFSYKMFREAFNKEINDLDNSFPTLVEELNVEAEKFIKVRQAELDAETDPSKIPGRQRKLEWAQKNVVDVNSESIQKILKAHKARLGKKYANILSNAVTDSIFKALSNVSTAVELNTPISMAMFSSLIKRIEEFKDADVDYPMNGETFMAIFSSEDLAAQGKEAIGIYATVLKINSAIQAAKTEYDTKYRGKLTDSSVDPFYFKSSITYSDAEIISDNKKLAEGETPKPSTVEYSRTGFADIDRFEVLQSIEESPELQQTLISVLTEEDEFQDSDIDNLVILIENEILDTARAELKHSKKAIKETLTPEQKIALGKVFRLPLTNANIGAMIERFRDPKAVIPTDMVKAIFEITGTDVSKGRGKIIDMLRGSHIRYTSEVKKVAANKIESLLNIQNIDPEILESVDPVEAFAKMLKQPENRDQLATAFSEIIGKQLSNDIQSQFLSAATDNAKALILGKIKSNSLTNPLITAMMLLGYDTDAVIKFLYDKDISAILKHYQDSASRSGLTPSGVKALNIGSGKAKNSLIHILEIGDEISKFRAVRSLNENAEIEQYKIDKILKDLDSDRLYKAITANNGEGNIHAIKTKKGAQEVFNANMMVFLHPQSRSLFINLYEGELKARALSRKAGIVEKIATKYTTSSVGYKNIFSYLAGLEVENFLNSKAADGNIRTGITLKKEANGTYSEELHKLNTAKGRGEFVKGFPEYLQTAKNQINAIGGIENTALNAIDFTNTFKSSNAVLGVPILKTANIDSVEAALIFSGIEALNTETGYPEVDKIQQKLYQNLSLYSLIVSNGEVKKGSMVDLFKEINLDFAKHLNNLNEKDYAKFIPKNSTIKDIVGGNLSTLDNIKAEYLRKSKAAQNGQEYEESSELRAEDNHEAMENMNYGDQGIGEEVEEFDEYSKKKVTVFKLAPSIAKVHKGTTSSTKVGYRIIDRNLNNAIFYPHSHGEIAYRIFDKAANEALPQTTVPDTNIHVSTMEGDIEKEFIKELGMVGKQLGFDAVYGGEKVRILAYAGTEKAPNSNVKYDQYIIYHKTGNKIVPGAHLMQENTELLLKGNIIENINPRNVSIYNRFLANNKAILEFVPNTMYNATNTIEASAAVKKIFDLEQLKNDSILATERKVLGGAAYDVIKTKKNEFKSTPSYTGYHNSAEIPAAIPGSRRTLIPAFYSDVYQGKVVKSAAMLEMSSQIMDIINSLEIGTSVDFFGIKSFASFEGSTKEALIGGIDLLDKLFANRKKTSVEDGEYTMFGGSLRITRSTNPVTGVSKVAITKVKADSTQLFVNGRLKVLHTVEKANGGRAVKDTKDYPLILKAIENNLVSERYTKITRNLHGESRELLILKSDKGNLIFTKDTDRGFNDAYLQIIGGLTEADYTNKGLGKFKLANDEYIELINDVKNVIETNKSC